MFLLGTQHSELGTIVAFAAPRSLIAAVLWHKLHSGSHDRANRDTQRLRTCFPPCNNSTSAVPAELPARHCSGNLSQMTLIMNNYEPSTTNYTTSAKNVPTNSVTAI
jgi:hypothetical protein